MKMRHVTSLWASVGASMAMPPFIMTLFWSTSRAASTQVVAEIASYGE